jgi:hypothetical protein
MLEDFLQNRLTLVGSDSSHDPYIENPSRILVYSGELRHERFRLVSIGIATNTQKQA